MITQRIKSLLKSVISRASSSINEHLFQLGQMNAEMVVMKLLEREEYNDPKRLERFGYKVYSQTDEDGILAEIFRRVGIKTHTFVEFGVGCGIENNSLFLLLKGWRGLWIEANEASVSYIRREFGFLMKDGKLKLEHKFIRPDNIDGIISGAGFTGEIDMLSVDLDGNDYYVLDAIKCINPRVLVLEYNAKFPPPVKWVMAYDPNCNWNYNDYFGASLKAYEELAAERGYRLVGTNIFGINAFFVRNDLTEDKFFEHTDAENLYNRARYHMIPYIKSGHPPKVGPYITSRTDVSAHDSRK